MTRETAEACIAALAQTDIPTLDLTGGADCIGHCAETRLI